MLNDGGRRTEDGSRRGAQDSDGGQVRHHAKSAGAYTNLAVMRESEDSDDGAMQRQSTLIIN